MFFPTPWLGSTYKDLKQIATAILTRARNRLGSTYKDLKLVCSVSVSVSISS